MEKIKNMSTFSIAFMDSLLLKTKFIFKSSMKTISIWSSVFIDFLKSTLWPFLVLLLEHFCLKTKAFLALFCTIGKSLWKVQTDNPQRGIHALKVGILVSFLVLVCIYESTYKLFHENILLVLVFLVGAEFPTGKLVLKGVPKGLALILGVLLASLIKHFANSMGGEAKYQFIIIPIIFVVVALGTFLRFSPWIEKYLDDASQQLEYLFVLILLLPVINNTKNNIFKLSVKKVLVSGASIIINMVVSIVILPSWGRCELRKQFVTYLEALAKSCEACVKDYFRDASDEDEDPKEKEQILKGCIDILDARSKDEDRIMYIRVGAWFTCRCHKFPLEEYGRIGESISKLARRVAPMHEVASYNQVPRIYKQPFTHLASEMAKLLREVGDSLKNCHTYNPEASFNNIVEALKEIAKTGQRLEERGVTHAQGELIKVQPQPGLKGQTTFTDIISNLGLTRLNFGHEIFPYELLEAVRILDPIILAVEEFATKCKFKKAPLPERRDDIV